MVKNCNNCAHRKGDVCMIGGYNCVVEKQVGRKCGIKNELWQLKEPLTLSTKTAFFTIGMLFGLIIGYVLW